MNSKLKAKKQLIKNNQLPKLPDFWEVERFRYLFTESKERNGDIPVGEMLSVSEYRGVIPKLYEYKEQKRNKEELRNYRVVRPGQLAVNSMWLNHLGLGVSDHTGHISPAYAAYSISPRLNKRFVHHLMRSNYYINIYMRYLYGIRPNSFQIKSNDWMSIPIIIPPQEKQREIADFLDQETARIDKLIEKKWTLIETLPLKAEALIDATLSLPETKWIRFGYTAKTIFRPVEKQDNEVYIAIGLYNRGRGIFHKGKKYGQDLGDSTFNWVKPEDLIFSGQFAWEGAVALATKQEANKIASHRYPIYNARNGIKNAYLFSYFRSYHGKFLMNDCSRGAAGRNRPLNTNRLEKEQIPIPPSILQKQIVALVQQEAILKSKIMKSIQALRILKSAIVTEAVTGQLDILK